jgi:hypothetical protein
LSIYASKPLYLKEFVVANFRTKFRTPELRAWKAGSTTATAESCNRQVWFGLQDDFANFPARDNPDIQYYEGPQAHAFMTRLYCGLESARVGEDSIKGQLCDGWERFPTDDPRKIKAMDKILQDIKADSRFVMGAVLKEFKPHRHEIAARDLSGQQKGDKALLIGSMNRAGKLSSFTDGLARVIGNKRPGRVSEIAVTHPDTKTLRIIYDELIELRNRGILAADIVRVPFRDIGKAIEKADRLYVDLPMGSDPAAEEDIVLHWLNRVYKGNTLTHVRGNPYDMGASTPLWAEANLDNYVSPEDVRADMADRAVHNKDVIQNARDAIDFCADLRMGGDTPSNAKVRHFVAHGAAPIPVVA